MMNEIWKNVRFYEDRYEVSDTGKVRTCVSRDGIQKLLKQTIRNDKFYVTLYGNGYVTKPNKNGGRPSVRIKAKNFEVGYLVAMAFKTDTHQNERHVRHINGNLLDNQLSNLQWSHQTGK